MHINIDFKSVIPTSKIKGNYRGETAQLNVLFSEASAYLSGFKWCKAILESYIGIGIGDKLGVFLFKILPARSDVDEWIWVIVGDVPPAYITPENAPNAACALDGYIRAMRTWVEAVRAGMGTEDLIPVNADPTLENANELEGRLNFIRNKILIHYSKDLKA